MGGGSGWVEREVWRVGEAEGSVKGSLREVQRRLVRVEAGGQEASLWVVMDAFGGWREVRQRRVDAAG